MVRATPTLCSGRVNEQSADNRQTSAAGVSAEPAASVTPGASTTPVGPAGNARLTSFRKGVTKVLQRYQRSRAEHKKASSNELIGRRKGRGPRKSSIRASYMKKLLSNHLVRETFYAENDFDAFLTKMGQQEFQDILVTMGQDHQIADKDVLAARLRQYYTDRKHIIQKSDPERIGMKMASNAIALADYRARQEAMLNASSEQEKAMVQRKRLQLHCDDDTFRDIGQALLTSPSIPERKRPRGRKSLFEKHNIDLSKRIDLGPPRADGAPAAAQAAEK